MIGVFDAGLGGLGLLAALVHRFPTHDFTYVGDTARLECGNQSHAEIRRQLGQHLALLARRGATDIFIACNSLASYALEVAPPPGVPVHSVIEAGVRAGSQFRRLLVLATHATVERGLYRSGLEAHGCTVAQVACPLFVNLVENNVVDGPLARAAVRHYLPPGTLGAWDGVLLGCTHFPFLASALREVIGDGPDFIDPSAALADSAKVVGPPARGHLSFLFTNLRPDIVARVRAVFGEMGRVVERIEEVTLC